MTKENEIAAKSTIDGANACTEHQTGILWDDVADVLYAYDSDPGNTDREGCAILLMKDGRYAAVWDSEDYTGHG